VHPASTGIGIAGAGRVGQALGRLLAERGEPVVAIASRRVERAEAAAAFIGGGAKPLTYAQLAGRVDRVLIAVPDDAVTAVAATLAESGMRAGLALHTCGARGPEALAPLAAQGVSCGAIHPLQTIATPERGLAALPGAAFAIDGDGEALRWAERIVAALDGQVLRIPADHRPLYHAAAVMASNYVVGLIDAAVILMGEAGIQEDAALRALEPLARESVANASRLGTRKALTGPIERGDRETVAAHLKALAAAPQSVRNLYCYAGLHLLGLARRKDVKRDG
jgi:predicted short-subunit dehydrogenase-like oxidoreductase (DUF2520 family)